MKRFIFVALAAIALIAPASAQGVYGAGGASETYVKTHNETGTMVWITAYSPRIGGGAIEGAWPVHPHSYDDHGLHALISDVRAEINAPPCSGGNKLDSQLGTHQLGKLANGVTAYELVGYVRFSGGHCTYTT